MEKNDDMIERVIKIDGKVKSFKSPRRKPAEYKGAQIPRNEDYLSYSAVTGNAAQHRKWTFYEAVKVIFEQMIGFKLKNQKLKFPLLIYSNSITA